MSNFPSSIINFLQLQDGIDFIIAAHPNDRGNEITALETMLGAMGAGQGYTESYKNLLKNYVHGCKSEYDDTTHFFVRTGEIVLTDGSSNYRFRVNVADITADFTMLDTGSVAANTTYYVYATADTSGTTFLIKLSTNATTPASSTFYRKIGSLATDGSSHIIVGSVQSLLSVSLLGAWSSISTGTIYQAATDGFAIAVVNSGSTNVDSAKLYSDSSSSPSTVRSASYTDNSVSGPNGVIGTIISPIKSGDYYEFVLTGTSAILYGPFFIPLTA